MEFKCLTNIETSFRQLRMYALVFAGICAVVTVAAVWMSYSCLLYTSDAADD